MASVLRWNLFLTPSRFCVLQSIQRRLEEIEVTFKDLEDKGVVLERTLREETGKTQVLKNS